MPEQVQYNINCSPTESVSQSYGSSPNILATEIGKKLRANGSAYVLVDGYGASGALQGFSDGAPYYLEAIDDATVQLSASTLGSFILIKNTYEISFS